MFINFDLRTSDETKGAMMEPTLAHMDADPTPTLRTTVGNSSPLNRYIVGKAIDDPIMPNDANMNLKCSTSESVYKLNVKTLLYIIFLVFPRIYVFYT